MSLRTSPRLRRAGAAVALLVYASLPLVSAGAGLAHGLHHLRGVLDVMEQRAAAMGVAHPHDAEPSRTTYVHSHGGPPHAHDAAAGALLAAADDIDQKTSEAITPPVKRAGHLPAVAGPILLATITHEAPTTVQEPAGPRDSFPPPLPPPRA